MTRSVSPWTEAARLRAVELLLLDLFREDKISGTVHTCVGQELGAVTLARHLRPEEDFFFGSHRAHGHLLALGAPVEGLLAELMGREGALCRGRGGSQNLRHLRAISSGIQGGTALLAIGAAWAQRLSGGDGIAVAQIGDGTLGEGALYEALTFSAVLELPVLFFLEWNGYAQSTDVTRTTRGDVVTRLEGFGLEVTSTSDAAPEDLEAKVCGAVARARGSKPQVLIVRTRRLLGHSKGDDVRDPELIRGLEAEDPLNLRLERSREEAEAYAERRAELRAIAEEVHRRPLIEAGELRALPPAEVERSSAELHADLGEGGDERIVEALNGALRAMLSDRPEVLVVGEDIADPYGGAFKVTRGLSGEFPERVFSTPVAEAGLVGLCNGAALAGYRPIAEIMFSDFATLAADQLINHAAKIYATYGEALTCPVTVRLVSGAGRGYGPTHSQSLESLFFGVPGLRVVALSHRHDPAALLRQVVLDDDWPTIFVEHKLLYPQRAPAAPPLDLEPVFLSAQGGHLPPLAYSPPAGVAPDATVVTAGGISGPCEAAMRALFVEEELSFDYFIFTQLWPLHGVDALLRSAQRTRRVVVVEEGYSHYGFGAAILSEVAHSLPGTLTRKVGLKNAPIPCARHLEAEVLPDASDVFNAIIQLCGGRR